MSDDKILVSKENINLILKGIISNVNSKISSKDISSPYLDKFNLGNILKTNGNGKAILADDGEYKALDTDKVEISRTNTDNIYKAFNIRKDESSDNLIYDVKIDSDDQNKLDKVKTNGDGTRFLCNNGEYIDITPSYNIITDEDITEIINSLDS